MPWEARRSSLPTPTATSCLAVDFRRSLSGEGGEVIHVRRLVLPSVAPESHEVAGAKRRSDRALELDNGDAREPGPEGAQHLGVAVPADLAETTEQEDVRTLRLEREPDLGLHREVGRGARCWTRLTKLRCQRS
jgi:hypothetical protein